MARRLLTYWLITFVSVIWVGRDTLTDGQSHTLKTIVVFTDGENKKGVEPEEAGRQVQSPMTALAKAGNGEHRHADNGTELIAIFRELASSFRTVITE